MPMAIAFVYHRRILSENIKDLKFQIEENGKCIISLYVYLAILPCLDIKSHSSLSNCYSTLIA